MKIVAPALVGIAVMLIAAFVWTLVQLPATVTLSMDKRMQMASDRLHETITRIDLADKRIDVNGFNIGEIQKAQGELAADVTKANDLATVNQSRLDRQQAEIDRLQADVRALSDHYSTDHDWILSQKFGDKAAKEAREAQRIAARGIKQQQGGRRH